MFHGELDEIPLRLRQPGPLVQGDGLVGDELGAEGVDGDGVSRGEIGPGNEGGAAAVSHHVVEQGENVGAEGDVVLQPGFF